MAIRSFRDRVTRAIFAVQRPKGFPADVARVAQRKLALIDAAVTLEVLRLPPGNRLETLHRDRMGQHSIRISNQFRICFRWTALGAEDVEIVDYH